MWKRRHSERSSPSARRRIWPTWCRRQTTRSSSSTAASPTRTKTSARHQIGCGCGVNRFHHATNCANEMDSKTLSAHSNKMAAIQGTQPKHPEQVSRQNEGDAYYQEQSDHNIIQETPRHSNVLKSELQNAEDPEDPGRFIHRRDRLGQPVPWSEPVRTGSFWSYVLSLVYLGRSGVKAYLYNTCRNLEPLVQMVEGTVAVIPVCIASSRTASFRLPFKKSTE